MKNSGFWRTEKNKINRGSLTVEAALVLPIFVFVVLTILYINRLLLYEEQVEWAITQVGREASLEQAASEKDVVVNPLYLTGKMNLVLPEHAPAVSMMRSSYDKENNQINLIADFYAKIPFPIISNKSFWFTEQVCTRSFCGVETRADSDVENDEMVYVTRTGHVFHRDISCSYLKLSISKVKFGDTGSLRSESGGRYYACESCGLGQTGDDEDVYICNYGDRFHKNRACRRIKRSIQEVKLSQVGDKLPCTKCGDEKK